VIRRFFRWLRRLLPYPGPRGAAQPAVPRRVLHLMDPGMRSACDGAAASAKNWVTVQLEHVNCKECLRIGRRRRVRRVTRVR
jgi:hypothetical protein